MQCSIVLGVALLGGVAVSVFGGRGEVAVFQCWVAI